MQCKVWLQRKCTFSSSRFCTSVAGCCAHEPASRFQHPTHTRRELYSVVASESNCERCSRATQAVVELSVESVLFDYEFFFACLRVVYVHVASSPCLLTILALEYLLKLVSHTLFGKRIAKRYDSNQYVSLTLAAKTRIIIYAFL